MKDGGQLSPFTFHLSLIPNVYTALFLLRCLELIETEDLKIIVFDESKEVIVRWIN